MKGEVWKDVVGYEGLYRVSDQGRVFSYITNRLRKLRKRDHRDGILQVGLSYDGKQTFYLVPRLVMQAFIKSDLSNKDHIIHLDGNVENNALSNLAIKQIGRNDTGFIRVVDGKKGTKYHAVVNTVDSKQIFLGSFTDKQSAESALDDYFHNKNIF